MVVLTDPYGRSLEYLRVSVVDACNMRCFYCRPGKGCIPESPRQVMHREEIVHAVAAGVAAGIHKVRLTGGEPLLRSDIVEIVAGLASLPGVVDLSLTTNGSLLKELSAPLAAAGLKRVNISLDSLHAGTFKSITRGGILKNTLAGIGAAISAGLSPVKLNVVVLKGINDHEVETFARLTMESDIHVRFIEYMPVPGQQKHWQSLYLPTQEIIARCRKVAQLVELPEANNAPGPANYYRYEKARGLLGFITPVSRHFCAKCNRLRLTCDGKIRPCLFSPAEVDLLPALSGKANPVDIYRAAAALKPGPGAESPAASGTIPIKEGMAGIGG